MIVSADISNFRCFSDVRLSGLRTINIVVGDNGAGKTALLEALFLASAASPEVANRVRNWRSGPMSAGAINLFSTYTATWGDFFLHRDLRRRVRIALKGTIGDSRTLEMFQATEPTELPLTDTGADAAEPIERPITFRWEHPGSNPIEVTPRVQGGNIMIPSHDAHTNINSAFLGSRQPVFAHEAASLYSDLRKREMAKPFEDMIMAVFEQIERLSVEIDAGSGLIYAKIKDVALLHPLHSISDGINRVAQILLNIAARPGGMLCVDEIDSGLYFARQPEFWKVVRKFSMENGTQLFASTHSLEALRAFVPAMREYPEHFTLLRSYRHKGSSKVAMVSGEDGLALIESGLEVR